MGVPNFMIAGALNTVVAQRLAEKFVQIVRLRIQQLLNLN